MRVGLFAEPKHKCKGEAYWTLSNLNAQLREQYVQEEEDEER
jgi:hypothetical protein